MNALAQSGLDAAERDAHERRVLRLEDAGWTRDDDGWQKDVGDLRWHVQKVERVVGSGFVENTRAAYGKQVFAEAEQIKLRQQKGAA